MDFIFRTDNSNAKFYGRHFSTKTSKKPVASATPMQTWDRNIQFTNPPQVKYSKIWDAEEAPLLKKANYSKMSAPLAGSLTDAALKRKERIEQLKAAKRAKTDIENNASGNTTELPK